MKKLYIITALLLCLGAQAQKVEWVKSLGLAGDDKGMRCAVDKEGNLLFTGSYTDTLDLGPGFRLKGTGVSDMFLLKTKPNGDPIWLVSVGCAKTKRVEGRALDVDNDNNVYVGGFFTDTLIINGTEYYGQKDGFQDGYVAKYSKDGVFSWVKLFVGPNGNLVEDLNVSNNKIAIVGSYRNTMVVNSTNFQAVDPNVSTNYNPFLILFDADGNTLWADKVDCKSGTCRALSVSPNGKINLLLEVKGTTPILRTVGTSYQFALKISESSGESVDDYILQINPEDGSSTWSNRMGSTGSEMGYAITTDKDNNIFIGGLYQSSVKLDTQAGGTTQTLTSKGGFDFFLCKYNSSGQLQWAKSEGDIKTEGVYDIAVSSGGFIYLASYFIDQTKVGDSTFTNTGITSFFSKYSSDGTFKWAQKATGAGGTSYFQAFCITPKDSIAFIGYFKGNGSFLDKTVLTNQSATNMDTWYGVISDAGNAAGIFTEKNNIKLSVFPVPANDQINIRIDSDQRLERTRIFDIIGNTLYDNSSERYTIPVSNYHNGVYLIEVTTNKGRSVQRIVINK